MTSSRDPNDPCLACAIAGARVRPPGGVLWRGGGLVLHGVADPSPLPGWLVLTTERHARGLYDLGDAELRALGPAAAAAMRAQRAALGAEHVYALALGDLLPHFHLHLVPRFAGTPGRLRGRGAFDARPEDALPGEEIERAAALVARALAPGGTG